MRTCRFALLAALTAIGACQKPPVEPVKPSPPATEAETDGKQATQPPAGPTAEEVWPELPDPWYAPTDIPTGSRQPDAVEYAWRSFMAMNWPAAEGQRGVPDTSKVFGMEGVMVWETWKRPEEVFLEDGSKPADWNTWSLPVPAACSGASPGDHVMTRTSKASAAVENVLESEDQAIGGTLTDQHGKLAQYEITLNQTIFDYIVGNGLYNVQGQQAFTADNSIAWDSSTMEIKASWRQLDDDPPEVQATFHQASAWVYDASTDTCQEHLMGLVGLHISQKTPLRPAWTWATFEHVANEPDIGGGDPPVGGAWSFYLEDCETACSPQPDCAQYCQVNMTTAQGRPATTPTQVERDVSVGSDAAEANTRWQASIRSAFPDSPWQYYALANIQWTTDNGTVLPTDNQNSTMETYIKESSCLTCHEMAKTEDLTAQADYSYLLAEAHEASAASGGEE